jgi:hypothetical protein
MPKFHLWPEEPVLKEEIVELAATLEKSNQERQRIWFCIPHTAIPYPFGKPDSFVLAFLFSLKEASADLEIHGEVSRSLLSNLTEFQRAWAHWLPERCHPVEF